MQDYAKLVGSLILAAAPAIERAGVLVRGQMALGAEAIEDSAYWWELLERYAPGSGQYRTVASASVLKLADGASQRSQRHQLKSLPSGLVDAIEDSGDIVIRIPWTGASGRAACGTDPPSVGEGQQLPSLAIASGGRDICAKYCETVLETASEAQNAEYGVPIFYVYGGYY